MTPAPPRDRSASRQPEHRPGSRRRGLLAALLLVAAAHPAGSSESATPLRSLLQRADAEGHPTVLHFWASWCAPCAEEMPSVATFYQEAYPQLRERGLRLVVVNNDVRREDLRDFLAERPLPFPVYEDSLSSLNDRLDLYGLPGTVVLGANGQVLERLLGPVDWQSAGFLERLEGYLGP